MTAHPLDALPEATGIGLALALGLLVGIERGWAQRDRAPGSRFAGVRSFGLLGLAGGFAGAFAVQFAALSAVVLAASAALVLMGYWRATQGKGSISGTASIVALLTLACGYLAGSGEGVIAAAAAALMVLVLAMRSQLHGWIAGLDEREVLAIARFALIALVILPILPDTPFGPYGAWRARQLWLVVVLVSGFSFSGYLAAKHFGASRGTLATAAAGAIVSSTAVTASLSGKLRGGEGDRAVNNAGIALASAVMFARTLVLTFAVAPVAFAALARVALPGMVVSLAATAWLLRKVLAEARRAPAPVKLRNPFDTAPALLLTALTMALMLVARWVMAHYGNAGLATVLAISGMVDVASAIITMGNLPVGAIEPRLAGLVLAPPILLNTLLKAGMALSVAGRQQGGPSALALVLSALAAIAGGLTLL